MRIRITGETINFEIIENCGLAGVAYNEEESQLYQYFSKLFYPYNMATRKRTNLYFSGTNETNIGFAHFSYGIGFKYGDFKEIKLEEIDRNTLKLVDQNVGEFIFKRL
ncbi:hypothetical protein SAMN05421640_1407 [Ekhidna lutea]|uniref:Uncharacterized protein n=1 Tax=Ekhidna lutea TaxID=447679 RepID=A0A239HR23_EKHLU|nr:hypothetical protein [Ekhidna lutea]SNS82744.1 hypothetical protein SAMN05421640_1407 [Ekhidna lutea]